MIRDTLLAASKAKKKLEFSLCGALASLPVFWVVWYYLMQDKKELALSMSQSSIPEFKAWIHLLNSTQDKVKDAFIYLDEDIFSSALEDIDSAGDRLNEVLNKVAAEIKGIIFKDLNRDGSLELDKGDGQDDFLAQDLVSDNLPEVLPEDSRQFFIHDPLGLHARVAGKIWNIFAEHTKKNTFELIYGKEVFAVGDMLDMLNATVPQGQNVIFRITGENKEEIFEKLEGYFKEMKKAAKENAGSPIISLPDNSLTGIVSLSKRSSSGIASQGKSNINILSLKVPYLPRKNKHLYLFEGIYNPAAQFQSEKFEKHELARIIALGEMILPGMKVLDLGCGSGYLAIVAAAKGAYVDAVDIKELAVKNTRYNAEKFRLTDRIRVILNDGLPAGKYDCVIWNMPVPMLPCIENDPNYVMAPEAIEGILRRMPEHFQEGGFALVRMFRIKKLMGFLKENRLDYQIIARDIDEEDNIIVKMKAKNPLGPLSSSPAFRRNDAFGYAIGSSALRAPATDTLVDRKTCKFYFINRQIKDADELSIREDIISIIDNLGYDFRDLLKRLKAAKYVQDSATIRLFVAKHPATNNKLGILRHPGAYLMRELIPAYTLTDNRGINIFVTEEMYKNMLKDPRLFVFIIDHEFYEKGISPNPTHRAIWKQRGWLDYFIDKESSINIFLKLYIDKLAEEGDLTGLDSFANDHPNDPDRKIQ
ncbi:MAG: 50S ribosomal protein L11 methyltransferase, partial [Candidatus Omnitrophota bacterium]